MTTNLPALVARLEALEKEATPGPWFSEYDAIPWHPNHTNPFIERGTSIGAPDAGPHNVVTGGAQDEQGGSVGVLFNEDARLIVAMRNALPQLLAELKQLQSLYTDQVINHQQALCDIQAWQKASGLGTEEWDYLQSTPDELADKIKRLQVENERLQSEAETAHAARRFASDKCAEEICTLRSEIEEWKTASGLEVGGCPHGVKPKHLEVEVANLRSANERMRAATKAYHDHVEQFMLVQDDETPTHEHWLEYTSLKLRLYAATGDDIDLRRAAEAVGDE